jgi:hypothetical protein
MGYDYGAVLASARPKGWGDVLSSIDRHDVYSGDDGTYGLETKPHVTVLYGLHEKVHEDLVCRMCQGLGGETELKFTGLSAFTDSDDYDVLKFDVESDRLRNMNKAFRGLPHTNDYPEYKPHMTVAYLKNGAASKYYDLENKVEDTCRIRKFEFTPAGAEGPAVSVPASS